MLGNKDLAILTNRLQVPLIISDILNGEGALTDDVFMGLHEILSDDQPDSALLSIALSAKQIATTHQDANASIALLSIECDRIIFEYGQLWLRNAQSKDLDDNLVFETLVHIPEDLEALNELLEITKLYLTTRDPEAASLCDIMCTQAKAQGMIAETFLESMNDLPEENIWGAPANLEQSIAPEIAEQALETAANNVIQFPTARVN